MSNFDTSTHLYLHGLGGPRFHRHKLELGCRTGSVHDKKHAKMISSLTDPIDYENDFPNFRECHVLIPIESFRDSDYIDFLVDTLKQGSLKKLLASVQAYDISGPSEHVTPRMGSYQEETREECMDASDEPPPIDDYPPTSRDALLKAFEEIMVEGIVPSAKFLDSLPPGWIESVPEIKAVLDAKRQLNTNLEEYLLGEIDSSTWSDRTSSILSNFSDDSSYDEKTRQLVYQHAAKTHSIRVVFEASEELDGGEQSQNWQIRVDSGSVRCAPLHRHSELSKQPKKAR